MSSRQYESFVLVEDGIMVVKAKYELLNSSLGIQSVTNSASKRFGMRLHTEDRSLQTLVYVVINIFCRTMSYSIHSPPYTRRHSNMSITKASVR